MAEPAEPAWKVAMRERKKKKEEEEKKKQAEEEAKRASIPAWKRAMLEKKGLLPGAGTSGGATTPAPSSTTTAPKTSATTVPKPVNTSSGVVNKFMFSAVKKKEESQPPAPASKPSTEQASASPTLKTKSTRVSAAKNLFEEIASSPQVPRRSPLSPVRKGLLESSDKSSGIAHTKEQFEKKPEHNEIVSDHEDIDAQKSIIQDITEIPSSPTKPSFASSPTLPSHSHPVKEVEQQKTDPSPPTTNVSQSSGVKKPAFTAQRKPTSYNTRVVKPPADSNDNIPAWKRELLARRKKKETSSPAPQQPTEAEPPSSAPAQSASVPPATVTPVPATTPPPSSSTVPPKASSEPQEKKREATVKKPEIVNASDKKDGGDSPKLLNKEGKSIRAPVIKSTGKWADIKEEDPEFKKLPMWKQELIKRRRRDMENRTAPIPKEEEKQEKKQPSLPSNITTPFDRINAQKESSLEPSKKPSHNLTPIKKTPSPITTSTETTEPSGISKIAGKFGSVKNIKKPPPVASPIKENGDTYTMIDEESSDEEATPPKHMKTARSSSILKIEGKVQSLHIIHFALYNINFVRFQILDSPYT